MEKRIDRFSITRIGCNFAPAMSNPQRLWVYNPSQSMGRALIGFLIGRKRPYSRLLPDSCAYIVFIIMAKIQKKKDSGKLEIKFPLSAGVDIGATLMQVCVPATLTEDHNRAFGTTTVELRKLTSWLKSLRIDHVAMEATGVYWIPMFLMMSREGLNPVLLNAGDVKNYTARKTDVNDAEWLMTLMRYGMVKPSFQVNDIERKLRNYTRHRQSLVTLASDVIRRMQKCLELMNIKLTEVISDITGKSGIDIIEAILSGCRDCVRLSSLADMRCRKSKDEIAKSLEGTWNEDLLFILSQHYEQYKLLRRQTEALDSGLEKSLNEITAEVLTERGGEVIPVIECGKKPKRQSNQLNFNFEYLATQIYGVNLMRIDGVSSMTLLTLMGELGANFTDSFKSAAHFCSWCNLSPNDKISGGKILSSHIKKRSNTVGQTLRNCAQSMAGSKSVLGDYYRRMRAKGGGKYAVCVTAHKLATIIYTMVKNKTEYNPAQVSISDNEWLKKRIFKQEQLLKRLQNQLIEVAM